MIYTPPPFKLKHDIGKLERVTLSGHSVTPDFNEKEGKHIQISAIRKSCLLSRCSIGDDVNKFLVDTGSIVWWHTSAPYMQDKLCQHAT